MRIALTVMQVDLAALVHTLQPEEEQTTVVNLLQACEVIMFTWNNRLEKILREHEGFVLTHMRISKILEDYQNIKEEKKMKI